MLEKTTVHGATAERLNTLKQRRLPFSGAKNFRDLGGYQTKSGRTVRWGSLYRSDSLHKLTAADLRYLSALCLDRVVDLRSTPETNRDPDRLPEELTSRFVHIPILDSSTGLFHNSRDEFLKIIPTVDGARSMIDTNIELATRFTPEIRQFLDILCSSNGPVLFHCAAGKDRTGFTAAIILRLLGVAQDVVMEDYLLTNQYFFSAYRWSLGLMRVLRGRRFAETVRNFMIAQPGYLGSAFTAMEEKYGSFEGYVSDGLGLTAADIAHLQSMYLE